MSDYPDPGAPSVRTVAVEKPVAAMSERELAAWEWEYGLQTDYSELARRQRAALRRNGL